MDTLSDLPPIDILTFITDELLQAFRSSTGEKDKVKVFTQFLDRWEHDPSIAKLKTISIEFESDLDWFNVSRPLKLSELRGKVVILDFFTYCCINCMHVLPELHRLEKRFPVESGLLIIGVHSPKFMNERAKANILSAAQRYGITHPIVNDFKSALWQGLGIRCWPTLIVLCPTGVPLLLLMGEGHGNFLEEFLSTAISFFNEKGNIKNNSLPLQISSDQNPASNLRFPAKIARSPNGRFAVADAGNNRVLIMGSQGLIKFKVGGTGPGFVNGNFSEARFNRPQGLTFLDENTLIVADTENHALRKVSLSDGLVETLAGTGVQGNDRIGGRAGPLQCISSPWDVAIFRTRDMDMSFHLDEQNVPEKTIVLIAMAGSHQIWGYFPEETIWWKFRKFDSLCCVSLIGNGLEENRNNSYPQNAAFAQPSGLAMSNEYLFIADSESSSIRKASLIDGKVMPVVGGDRNPLNLFAFGDIDGKLFHAKLQHPLGVTCNAVGNRVFVADTYNHKIKLIDTDANSISTLTVVNEEGIPMVFNEPAGICLDADECYILVADTNNHLLYKVDLQTLKAEQLLLDFSQVVQQSETDAPKKVGETLIKTLPLHFGATNTIHFMVRLEGILKFTDETPQKWIVKGLTQGINVSSSSGTLENGKCDVQFHLMDQSFHKKGEVISIEFILNLCETKYCLMKRILITLNSDPKTNEFQNTHNVFIRIGKSKNYIE
ncbi:hypothetical protein KR018_005673 [Drosophila ironensis]|nr:hypothetical protein KR018_005673 [Drosophila ironensis]